MPVLGLHWSGHDWTPGYCKQSGWGKFDKKIKEKMWQCSYPDCRWVIIPDHWITQSFRIIEKKFDLISLKFCFFFVLRPFSSPLDVSFGSILKRLFSLNSIGSFSMFFCYINFFTRASYFSWPKSNPNPIVDFHKSRVPLAHKMYWLRLFQHVLPYCSLFAYLDLNIS